MIFYGEGWDMKTELTKPGVQLAVQTNSAMVPGFGFFSDTIRDLLRGTTFESTAPGFVAGAVVSKEALEACFMGMPSWAAQPDQCVNYASCHDNTTLFDRIALHRPGRACRNPDSDEQPRRRVLYAVPGRPLPASR